MKQFEGVVEGVGCRIATFSSWLIGHIWVRGCMKPCFCASSCSSVMCVAYMEGVAGMSGKLS
jgi:hypothetical protein